MFGLRSLFFVVDELVVDRVGADNVLQAVELVQAWLNAGAIDYRKPARSHLHYEFRISEEDLAAARERLPEKGYSVHTNQVDAIDADGDVCAAIECVSYLRLLQPQEAGSAGF